MTGGGGGGSNTVTQVQQIPKYEQEFSQANQNLATSLASTPYPVYHGQLVAPLTANQNLGINQAVGASTAYQPYMAPAAGAELSAMNPVSASNIAPFMSPYVAQSLIPQILGMQTQLGQQQRATDAQATGAGAFGDARHGVAEALNNFYGDQTLAGILGQGYNNAFTTALQAYQNQQQLQQQGGMNLAQLGGLNQQYGITGANATEAAGAIQQQNQQQALTAAYQQFLNQSQWPFQMLNVRESAISNSPYNIANTQTVPSANMTAANLGAFGALASGVGNILGGNRTGP